MPAVGFAVLLRYLPVKKHMPYLILGFVITALLTTIFGNIQLLGDTVATVVDDFSNGFVGMPMLAVALIGFGLAFREYKRTYRNTKCTIEIMEQLQMREIEDDEL